MLIRSRNRGVRFISKLILFLWCYLLLIFASLAFGRVSVTDIPPSTKCPIIVETTDNPVQIYANKPIPIEPTKHPLLDAAQIIASFASLSVLLFLLWQNILLQRQTKALSQSIRSATYQNIVNHYLDINKTLSTNTDVAEAFASFTDIRKISSVNEHRREWLAWWLLNHYENSYMQYRLGVLPEHLWKGIEHDCLTQIKKPYILKLWEKSQEFFCQDFKSFISNHLDSSESAANDKPNTSTA